MTDADNVGWLFIHQYYSQLNTDPSQQHRFYTKESRLVHSEGASQGSQAVGQQEIKAKFAEHNLVNCKVMIDTVDCLPSVNHGILVQVMGEMSNSGKASRKFVQTFLLAPNEKGFFIKNDVLRFYTEANNGSRTEPETEPESEVSTNEETEPEILPQEQPESAHRESEPEAIADSKPEEKPAAVEPETSAATSADPASGVAASAFSPEAEAAASTSGALCNDIKKETVKSDIKAETANGKTDEKKLAKSRRTPRQANSAYVRNVPKDVDEKALYNSLNWFGRLTHFQCEPSKSRAFVDFADAQALERALVRGKVVVNGVEILVERRKRRTDPPSQ